VGTFRFRRTSWKRGGSRRPGGELFRHLLADELEATGILGVDVLRYPPPKGCCAARMAGSDRTRGRSCLVIFRRRRGGCGRVCYRSP
jgi:hypothetical protein